MADPLSLGLTGIGFLGSLFGGEEELTDEQRQAYEGLLKRSKGLDPKLLQLMRARLKGAVGSEFSALTSSRMSQLRRQDAPNVIQRQEFEKLATRRAGGITDALLGVDQLNEQIKGQALGQLAGFAGRFPQRQPFGQGFSQMFGAGLQGLLGGGGNAGFLEELNRLPKHNVEDDILPNVPSPYDMFRDSQRKRF